MQIAGGVLYTGGGNGAICQTVVTESSLSLLNKHPFSDPVTMLKYLSKMDWVVAGFASGTVRIFKTEGFKEYTWFKVHKTIITDLLYFESLNLFMVLDLQSNISSWKILDQAAMKMQGQGFLGI